MAAVSARCCDNTEGCSVLGAEYFIGHWIRLPQRDLEFCSVSCAMEWAHLGPMWHGMADDREAIEAAVNERVSFNPDARAELARWRTAHTKYCDTCEVPAAISTDEVEA